MARRCGAAAGHTRRFKHGAIIAAAAVGVLAQGGGLGLSSSCQNALNDTANGPAGTCLNVRGFVDIYTETQGSESLISPVDSWLSSICSQPACTNATIDAVISNFSAGCRTDLVQENVMDDQVQTIVGYIKTYYPVAREVVCLKDSNASGQFCVSDGLKRLENQIGAPLTPNNLRNPIYSSLTLNSIMKKNVICTDCMKAGWNMVKPYTDSTDRAEIDSELDGVCGSGFANSPAPASIQRTANSGTQAANDSQNGATITLAFESMMTIALGAVATFSLL
ncbi:hypothetical protein FRC09_001447 [Ceratobasidium sp. 395]|nr:hypothetical protein FRC09_001447 [Ceratobasidium sp. 395]